MKMLRLIICGILLSLTVTKVSADKVLVIEQNFAPKAYATSYRSLAETIEQAVNSPVQVRLLSTKQIIERIESNEPIDFALTDALLYEKIHHKNPLLSKFLMVKRNYNGRAHGKSAGVILTNNTQIREYGDLEGKRIAVANEDSLSAYYAQYFELSRAMVNLGDTEFKITGSEFGVLNALAKGDVDVGFVSSYVYENWSAIPRRNDVELMIVGEKIGAQVSFSRSTPLYPESILLIDSNIPKSVVHKLRQALMLDSDSLRWSDLGIVNFLEPADLRGVEELMIALKIPPYDSSLNRFEWDGNEKWLVITLSSSLLLIFLLATWVYFSRVTLKKQSYLYLIRVKRLLGLFKDDTSGSVLWNLESHTFELDAASGSLLGLQSKSGFNLISEEEFVKLMHPDHLLEFQQQSIEHINGTSTGFDLEVQMQNRKQQWIWMRIKGLVIARNGNSRPSLIAMTFEDIRKRKVYDRIQKLHYDRDQLLLELPKLAQSLEKPAFLLNAINQIVNLTESEYGFIYVLDHEKENPPVYYSRISSWSNSLVRVCPQLADEDFIFNSGLLRETLEHGKIGVSNSKRFEFSNLVSRFQVNLMFKRYLIVPLVKKDYVTMVIGVANREEAYNQEIREMLVMLLQQISNLIENKRYLRELREQREFMQRIIEDIGHNYAVFSLNPNTLRPSFISESIEEIVDIPRDELIQKGWQNEIDWVSKDSKKMIASLRDLSQGLIERVDIEMHFNDRNGVYKTIRVHAHSVQDSAGKITEINGIVEDITSSVNEQKALRQAANVFEHAQDSILVMNAAGKIQQANQSFMTLTGFSLAELKNRSIKFLQSEKEDSLMYDNLIRVIESEGNWSGQLWGKNKFGEDFYYRANISSVYDDSGKLDEILMIMTEMTAEKRYQDQIEYLAHNDTLTGLANRETFMLRLESLFTKSKASQEHLVLVFIDLDGFKAINDNFGHDAGDALLIEVSKRMTNLVRANDLVARLGGDEFVIILESIVSQEWLQDRLESLLKDIEQPVEYQGEALNVSASIGVSQLPNEKVSTPEELLKLSDNRMYQAKSSGKGRIVYVDQGALH